MVVVVAAAVAAVAVSDPVRMKSGPGGDPAGTPIYRKSPGSPSRRNQICVRISCVAATSASAPCRFVRVGALFFNESHAQRCPLRASHAPLPP